MRDSIVIVAVVRVYSKAHIRAFAEVESVCC